MKYWAQCFSPFELVTDIENPAKFGLFVYCKKIVHDCLQKEKQWLSILTRNIRNPGVLRWVLKCKYCPTITLNDIIHRLFTFIVVSKDAISDELTNLFRKLLFPKKIKEIMIIYQVYRIVLNNYKFLFFVRCAIWTKIENAGFFRTFPKREISIGRGFVLYHQ